MLTFNEQLAAIRSQMISVELHLFITFTTLIMFKYLFFYFGMIYVAAVTKATKEHLKILIVLAYDYPVFQIPQAKVTLTLCLEGSQVHSFKC